MTECEHDWKVSWDHHKCVKCPAVITDGGTSWGVARNKPFSSLEEARFYKERGRLPAQPVKIDPFRNVDVKDCDWLLAYLNQSGHGQFWKAVITEFRASLTEGTRE